MKLPETQARELATPELLQEMLPLLVEHWSEVAHFKDIPLNPDLGSYLALENSGILRVYTMRRSGELLGYAVFVVRRNMHYMDSLQANQDVLFVRRDLRGFAPLRFIRFCDEQLEAEGVQAVYHHVKSAHNFGLILERMGYDLVDVIYARRLNKES